MSSLCLNKVVKSYPSVTTIATRHTGGGGWGVEGKELELKSIESSTELLLRLALACLLQG